MSPTKHGAVLSAAYSCFTRYGVRRTTMDDIAQAAGMSRPAVYQHVRNKEDAFHQLVAAMLTSTVQEAGAAATSVDALEDKLSAVLLTKLALVQRVWRDAPAHAAELLAVDARMSADLLADYDREMLALLRGLAADRLGPALADELSHLLLALTRGLEADLPTAAARVRVGVDLLVAGATASTTDPIASTSLEIP